MRSLIPKVIHFLPWNFWIFIFYSIIKIFGRFSNNLKIPYYGINGLVIFFEMVEIQSFDIFSNPAHR